MCLLTSKRYKTYQTGFSFGRQGHAPGFDAWGYHAGVRVKFVFRNSTRFDVWVTYINGTCNGTGVLVLAPWGLGEVPKGKISLINFKDFLNQKIFWICYVISVLYLLYFCARLFIYALWSPAGKGLTSWPRLWCLIFLLVHWVRCGVLLNRFLIFAIFLTLFIFSQRKDIKHIRRDFIWSPGSCPRVLHFGVLGVKDFIFWTWSCGIYN